jgi:hypothetical protein
MRGQGFAIALDVTLVLEPFQLRLERLAFAGAVEQLLRQSGIDAQIGGRLEMPYEGNLDSGGRALEIFVLETGAVTLADRSNSPSGMAKPMRGISKTGSRRRISTPEVLRAFWIFCADSSTLVSSRAFD